MNDTYQRKEILPTLYALRHAQNKSIKDLLYSKPLSLTKRQIEIKMQMQCLKEGNLTKCAKISWYIISEFKWAVNNGIKCLRWQLLLDISFVWPIKFCTAYQRKYFIISMNSKGI